MGSAEAWPLETLTCTALTAVPLCGRMLGSEPMGAAGILKALTTSFSRGGSRVSASANTTGRQAKAGHASRVRKQANSATLRQATESKMKGPTTLTEYIPCGSPWLPENLLIHLAYCRALFLGIRS